MYEKNRHAWWTTEVRVTVSVSAIYEEIAQKFRSFDRVKFKQNLGVLYRDSLKNITHVRQCLYEVALDRRPDTPKGQLV